MASGGGHVATDSAWVMDASWAVGGLLAGVAVGLVIAAVNAVRRGRR